MQRLIGATKPPGFAWVRAGIRLAVAGVLYLTGFPHAALVVAILAVVSVVATIEAQFSRLIAGQFLPPDSTIEKLRESVKAKQAAMDRQQEALAKKDRQIAQLKDRSTKIAEDV